MLRIGENFIELDDDKLVIYLFFKVKLKKILYVQCDFLRFIFRQKCIVRWYMAFFFKKINNIFLS